MAAEIYHRLREQLDQYSVGYPATRSGVEISLLEKLFTEEEAELFLSLSLMLETAESVAQRTGRDPEATAALLETMTGKGLVFHRRKGEEVRYAAVPYVVGFFEFQVERMDRELARLTEDYFEEACGERMAGQRTLMRTIPVNKSLEVAWPVAPYDDARRIIKSKDRIAVARCICRVSRGLLDAGCDKPLETCFMFGSHADYYVEHNLGRLIDQEEALRILDQCQEAGLVTQPFNAVNPGGMCNCCGDCCGILRALKKHPRPIEMVVSSYYAQVDSEACTGCETCLERCQMEAVALNDDGLAQVDLERCIGCGLCVTSCPTEAVRLVQKAESPDLPANGQETYLRLAQERGTSLVPLAVLKRR